MPRNHPAEAREKVAGRLVHDQMVGQDAGGFPRPSNAGAARRCADDPAQRRTRPDKTAIPPPLDHIHMRVRRRDPRPAAWVLRGASADKP